jgi:glycosyltransferase involved in cell wall biosynthesis
VKAAPVCLLLRYFTVGGLERVVTSLANAYVERGIDTMVLVMSGGKRNALITELDARVKLAILSGPVRDRWAEMVRLTRGRVVHIHFGDGRIHPFVRLLLGRRRLVVTYHSVYRHKRTWFHNRVDQICASRAAGVIAVSQAVKQFCVEDVGIGAGRISVIPNVLPGHRPATGNGIADEAPPSTWLALALASLYPHKNQRVLLEGVAAARKLGVDLRLRIIGDGPCMAELYGQCVELGLASSVDWYGAVWKKELVEPLIASSHLFISASRFEGLPLSVLEGMSHGLPLVLSDIPPHHEAAGDDALYFDHDDPAQLAARIVDLVRDQERRRRLCAASRARAAAFNFDACVDQHLQVYERAGGT